MGNIFRREGWLKPIRGDHIPSRIITVGWTSVATTPDGGTAPSQQARPGLVARPDRCALRLRTYHLGQVATETEYDTANPALAWSWIAARLIPGTLTWLFVCQALDWLTIWDGWGELRARHFNLAGVDLHDSASEPGDREAKSTGYCVLEDPPTIVLLRAGDQGGLLEIVDTRNYGGRGWSDLLGRNLGRLAEDFNAPVLSAPDPGLAGLRADAVTEWTGSFLTLVRDNKLGSVRPTAAAQAWGAYRRRHLAPYQLHITVDEGQLALERQSLYAGRCEVHYRGTVRRVPPDRARLLPDPADKEIWLAQNIYHLDANSLYLWAAANTPVPEFCTACPSELPPQGPYVSPEPYGWIAAVKVRTDEPLYPLRSGEETIWPTGTFWTVLAWPELRRAISAGHVTAFSRCARYFCTLHLRNWALWAKDLLDTARERGVPTEIAFAKLLGVATIGKFAQYDWSWVSAPAPVAVAEFEQFWGPHPTTNKPVKWRAIFGLTQYQDEPHESPWSMPSITAWIASAGRLRLWDLIQVAGLDNVYYWDTDSLWCNEEGYLRLDRRHEIHPTDLGKLRVVARHEHVDFVGLKQYIADGHPTWAGYAGTVVPSVRMEPIEAALVAHRTPRPVYHLIERGRAQPYRHGIVGPDGWVTPYVEVQSDHGNWP